MNNPTSIQVGVPVQLAESVWRLTAPNPGVFTGPGTNTYLIGETETLVLDPGPNIPEHIDAIVQASSGKISSIVVTHTHPDHSPGAAPLAQRTGAPVAGQKPAHPSEGNGLGFEPDRPLQHGDLVQCGEMKLQAVHTPGHASNHLCFVLESERMLFSGDHIMQGSTVVIGPPDGDMRAYMRSLQLIKELPIDCIAPGHGHVITDPVGEVQALIAHRLKRERKVVEKLGAFPDGCGLSELVRRVYDDVDPHLLPIAEHSLLAHLLKLEQDGVASQTDGAWRPAS